MGKIANLVWGQVPPLWKFFLEVPPPIVRLAKHPLIPSHTFSNLSLTILSIIHSSIVLFVITHNDHHSLSLSTFGSYRY